MAKDIDMDPNNVDLFRIADEALAGTDTGRTALLRQAERQLRAKSGAQTREALRIAAKYGDGSPEAEAANARLTVARRSAQVLSAERQRAEVQPVFSVAANTAIVHGRVVDATLTGQLDLRVQAVDARGVALASDTTDGNGYFNLKIAGAPRDAGVVETNEQPAPATTAKAPPARVEATSAAVVVRVPSPIGLKVLHKTKVLLSTKGVYSITAGAARYVELQVPATPSITPTTPTVR